MSQYKRKKLNLAVKRDFQRWLLLRIFSVVLLSSLVAALIFFIYTRRELGASFYEAHITVRQVSDLLWLVVAAGALVSLLSGMALALFLPQKLAGPIYRIERELEGVRRGDLTVQIKLRSGDPLHDLAGCINRTVDVLRVRVHDLQEVCADLEQAEQCGILRERIRKVCAGLETYRT
jgi:methyl-accepting chemotaxis protein